MKKEQFTLEAVMTAHPKLSLKRVCDVLEIGYQYILKTSKQPIAGQPYDPATTNYAAVQAILDRKGIKLEDTDWAVVENSVVTFEPINKREDFEIGCEFKLRADDSVYALHMSTATHVVFMAVDSTQPRVMNWDTFMHQSPRILNK